MDTFCKIQDAVIIMTVIGRYSMFFRSYPMFTRRRPMFFVHIRCFRSYPMFSVFLDFYRLIMKSTELHLSSITAYVLSECCPHGYVHNGNSCYLLSHDTETWADAMVGYLYLLLNATSTFIKTIQTNFDNSNSD